uniref:Uncharacterized protein n=1 Tax=Aureoumbra lagunensis TaxID=44058 RepID=A0A7S3NKI4_9STRA
MDDEDFGDFASFPPSAASNSQGQAKSDEWAFMQDDQPTSEHQSTFSREVNFDGAESQSSITTALSAYTSHVNEIQNEDLTALDDQLPGVSANPDDEGLPGVPENDFDAFGDEDFGDFNSAEFNQASAHIGAFESQGHILREASPPNVPTKEADNFATFEEGNETQGNEQNEFGDSFEQAPENDFSAFDEAREEPSQEELSSTINGGGIHALDQSGLSLEKRHVKEEEQTPVAHHKEQSASRLEESSQGVEHITGNDDTFIAFDNVEQSAAVEKSYVAIDSVGQLGKPGAPSKSDDHSTFIVAIDQNSKQEPDIEIQEKTAIVDNVRDDFSGFDSTVAIEDQDSSFGAAFDQMDQPNESDHKPKLDNTFDQTAEPVLGVARQSAQIAVNVLEEPADRVPSNTSLQEKNSIDKEVSFAEIEAPIHQTVNGSSIEDDVSVEEQVAHDTSIEETLTADDGGVHIDNFKQTFPEINRLDSTEQNSLVHDAIDVFDGIHKSTSALSKTKAQEDDALGAFDKIEEPGSQPGTNKETTDKIEAQALSDDSAREVVNASCTRNSAPSEEELEETIAINNAMNETQEEGDSGIHGAVDNVEQVIPETSIESIEQQTDNGSIDGFGSPPVSAVTPVTVAKEDDAFGAFDRIQPATEAVAHAQRDNDKKELGVLDDIDEPSTENEFRQFDVIEQSSPEAEEMQQLPQQRKDVGDDVFSNTDGINESPFNKSAQPPTTTGEQDNKKDSANFEDTVKEVQKEDDDDEFGNFEDTNNVSSKPVVETKQENDDDGFGDFEDAPKMEFGDEFGDFDGPADKASGDLEDTEIQQDGIRKYLEDPFEVALFEKMTTQFGNAFGLPDTVASKIIKPFSEEELMAFVESELKNISDKCQYNIMQGPLVYPELSNILLAALKLSPTEEAEADQYSLQKHPSAPRVDTSNTNDDPFSAPRLVSTPSQNAPFPLDDLSTFLSDGTSAPTTIRSPIPTTFDDSPWDFLDSAGSTSPPPSFPIKPSTSSSNNGGTTPDIGESLLDISKGASSLDGGASRELSSSPTMLDGFTNRRATSYKKTKQPNLEHQILASLGVENLASGGLGGSSSLSASTQNTQAIRMQRKEKLIKLVDAFPDYSFLLSKSLVLPLEEYPDDAIQNSSGRLLRAPPSKLQQQSSSDADLWYSSS